MTHPNKRILHTEMLRQSIDRQAANQIILNKLTEYLQANPDMRFSQALGNLNIVINGYDYPKDNWENDYYTEPTEVLKRMK
jgi:hypothetical protein